MQATLPLKQQEIQPDLAAIDSRVAVVIPYFQRKPGILARTLQSVFRQRYVARPTVIVVDDGSPVPAESELARLSVDFRDSVTVIHQPNQGPPTARNTGLAAVPPGFQWVALLDSDDIWSDTHLSVAVNALNHGFDLFFADHARVGETESQFTGSGFRVSESQLIDPEEQVYAYKDDLFGPVLKHSPIGMSTLVMRRSGLGDLRFSNRLRLCDDLLFALDLAYRAPRVCVSTKVHVTYGKGVNISLVDWNSNAALRWKLDFSLYFDEIRRRYPLTHDQHDILDRKARSNREEFLRALLGMVRRGNTPDVTVTSRFLARNPKAIAELPALARREIVARIG